MKFLQLIRFPNLIIVVLTQYLLQYFILIPAFRKAELTPLLDHFHFFILVLSTLIIAAGGYIINDIEDLEIDKMNKPERVIVGKFISVKNAHRLYWGITSIGLLISVYLALYVNNLPLVLIYPTAIYLLYIYSKSLKKSVLWGNLIVSIFCSFVAGIVLFAERANFFKLFDIDSEIGNQVALIFLAYMLFAFFSTMFREIVKDIEDVDGDLKNNCTTLPIAHGIGIAKNVAYFFAIVLLGLLNFWVYLRCLVGAEKDLIFFIGGIILPLLFAIYQLKMATSKIQMHQVSSLAKYIMLSGILYLLFLI